MNTRPFVFVIAHVQVHTASVLVRVMIFSNRLFCAAQCIQVYSADVRAIFLTLLSCRLPAHGLEDPCMHPCALMLRSDLFWAQVMRAYFPFQEILFHNHTAYREFLVSRRSFVGLIS